MNALIIRDEFKVWIYKHYFIPSIRFLPSVHTISQTFYKHFITDITVRAVSVHPFEIGSKGYISSPNGNRQKSSLKKVFVNKVLNFGTKKVLWKKVLKIKSLMK